MTGARFPATGKARRGCPWRVGGNPGPDIGSDKCGCLLVGSTPGNGDTVDGGRHSGCRLSRRGLGATVAIHLASIGDDGLPRAGLVSIAVRNAGGVIGHGHRLEIHLERALAVVRQTTRPVYNHVSTVILIFQLAGPLTDGPLSVVRVATSPHADLDHHRCLRVLVGVCSLRCENTDGLAIDRPNDLRARPVNRVSVETVMVSSVVMIGTTAVAAGVSFPKVVGLHLGVVASKPFPVDFIQVVGLQDSTADNSSSRSGLDGAFHLAKHDVPAGLDQGPVSLLGDGEGCAIGGIVCDASSGSKVG